MIDRRDGKVFIECDFCPAIFDAGAVDLERARAIARDKGWRARKLVTEWIHACPQPSCNGGPA